MDNPKKVHGSFPPLLDDDDMTDILPFTVAILQLGDLNTDAAAATKRPRADIAWAVEDVAARVAEEQHVVLVPTETRQADSSQTRGSSS